MHAARALLYDMPPSPDLLPVRSSQGGTEKRNLCLLALWAREPRVCAWV